MKERPILFSTPMVKAILEGRKTQTRRIIKCKKNIIDKQIGFTCFTPDDYFSVRGKHDDGKTTHVFARMFRGSWVETKHIKCPYGKIGDILWVRETFLETYSIDDKTHYEYKADYSDIMANDVCWKPSIFMPRVASRIKLEITDLRVERLQNISEEDAIAEGIEYLDNQLVDGEVDRCRIYFHYSDNELILLDAKSSYQTLWDSINGKDSWGKNPWVWVINFKKL